MNNKFKNAALSAAVAMSVSVGASVLEAAPAVQNMPVQNSNAYVQQVNAPSETQIDLSQGAFDSNYFKSSEYQNSIKGIQFDEQLMKRNPALNALNGMIPIAVDKSNVDWTLKNADGFTVISNNVKDVRFPGRLDLVNSACKQGKININDPGTLNQDIFHNKSVLLMYVEKHNQDAWKNGGFSYNYKVRNLPDGKADITVTAGEYWGPHSDFKDYKPSCLTKPEYENFKAVFPEGLTERNACVVPYFAQSNRNFNRYFLNQMPDLTAREFQGIKNFNPRAFIDGNPVSKALRNQFGIDSAEQSNAASGVKQVSFEASPQSPKAELMSAVGQTTHDETIHVPAFRGKDEHNAATGARISAIMQLKQEGKTGYVDKVTCLGTNDDGTYKFNVNCKVYDTPNTAIKNMSFEKGGLENTDGVRNVSFWKDGVEGAFDHNKSMTAVEIDNAVTSLDKSDLERLESLQAHQKAKDMLSTSESVDKGPFGLHDFTFVPGMDGKGTAQLEYVLPSGSNYTEKDAADYGLYATKKYLGSQGRLTPESNISVKDVTRLRDGDLEVAVDATNVLPGMSKSYDLEDVRGTKVPEPFSIKDVMTKSEDLVKSTKDLAAAKVSEKAAGVALNEHMNTYVNGGNSFFDKIKTRMAVMSEFGGIEKLNEQTNRLSDRAAEAVRNSAKASQSFDNSVDSLRQSVAKTCQNDPKVMKSFEQFASNANAFKYAVNEGYEKNTRSAEKRMKESFKDLQGEIKTYGKSYELKREAIRRDDELSKAPAMISPGMSDKQICQVLLNKEMSGGTTSLREAEKIVAPELVKRFGNDGKGNIDFEKGVNRAAAALNGVSSNHINTDSKAEVNEAAKSLRVSLNVNNNEKGDKSRIDKIRGTLSTAESTLKTAKEIKDGLSPVVMSVNGKPEAKTTSKKSQDFSLG